MTFALLVGYSFPRPLFLSYPVSFWGAVTPARCCGYVVEFFAYSAFVVFDCQLLVGHVRGRVVFFSLSAALVEVTKRNEGE